MSGVRVLVGTRKGAFILTSDGKREVGRQRPALRRLGDLPPQRLAGRSEPDLRVADQRLVRPDHPALRRRRQNLAPARHAARRTDHHARRHAQGREQQVRLRHVARNRQAAHHAPVVRRHAAPVGVQTRLALEPSLTDPDTVYAGVEDAALFRSTDGGKTWHELAGLRGHGTGPTVVARRRRHGPAHHPARPNESQPHVTSPSPPPAPSAPTTAARPGSRSTAACTRSTFPIPTAEVGHCVHRIAMHPSRPDVLFMQKHWDVMRTDNAGDSWHEVSGNLPTDFGFPIDVHAHEPDTIYVVPIKSDSRAFPPEGKLRVYRSRTGGNEWEPLTNGLPQSNCYVNVLRDAMAVDSLDACGIYFGTTGGQVYAPPTAATTGRRSSAICRPCCPSKCRRCHDPSHASARICARWRTSTAR